MQAFARHGIHPSELWDLSPAAVMELLGAADREKEYRREERAYDLVLLTKGIAQAVNTGKGLSMVDVLGLEWEVERLQKQKDADDAKRKAAIGA